MRITNGMQIARTLLDQNRNLQKFSDYNNDMSSRTTLHRPSDDPVRVSRAMRLTTELAVNSMYKSGLNDSVSWTKKTDDSLNSIAGMISRIRELTVQASQDTVTAEDKRQILAEIQKIKDAAVNAGNDDYMGRYQFSGFDTDKKFVNEDGSYNTELNLAALPYQKIDYNVGVGQKTPVNFSGIEVFGSDTFRTVTRADSIIDFNNEDKVSIEINCNIYLKKYEDPKDIEKKAIEAAKKEYTGPEPPIDEDDIEKKAEILGKIDKAHKDYENTTKLTGPEVDSKTLNGISVSGKYKKSDFNQLIKDLNKQLDEKIADPDIRRSVSFVNDDGKISLVTANNYSAKIEINTATVDGDDQNFMPKTDGNFPAPERENMPFFEMIDRISSYLEEDNAKGLSRMLNVVDYHSQNNLKIQGKGGARTKMYSIMLERTEDVKLNYSDLLSKTRDTDYQETSMQMMVAQYVYRASLSVTAKIIQPSLVDFLR